MINDGDRCLVEEYKGTITGLLYDIENDAHCGYRELSIVKTKLEECEMWLDKLLAKGVLDEEN